MKAPRWMRRWLYSRQRWEQQVADSERQAVRATRETHSLREQLAVARQQRDDARARESAVRWAATEDARTVGHVRRVLDGYGQEELAVLPAGALADDLRRVLDGGQPTEHGDVQPEVDRG